MPRGKPRKHNPTLYEGSPEPPEPSMTRQFAAHRRGGTHKVRDEHKTDSIYDTYNYKELVDEAKERGIYRKDMKKVEMAWALKHNDEEKKRAERDAVLALQRKQNEAKEEEERRATEKHRQIEEKHMRRIEKERKRERDESVSDDTVSDADIEAQENMRNEYRRERFGQALSDESWDSTSTESSTPSVSKAIKPDCRLRLFEWPYEKMPSLVSTQARTFVSLLEPLPRRVPYAPLKITTTSSKQKLVLSGLRYPPGIDPDFVPILSASTRSAARNGHLLGPLRKAVIESGVDWAKRTLVQGWNAHMYFHLGPRNEAKALADTYTKWCLENRKLLRVKGKGDVDPVDRAARHAQRQRNKTKKTAEVYEASLWRPGAMCYVPSYLDYGNRGRGEKEEEEEEEEEEEDRVLENLFFIRFPGCDVPHYYFWTRGGDWGDSGFTNPACEPGQLEADDTEGIDEGEKEGEIRQRRHVCQKQARQSDELIKPRSTRFRKPFPVLLLPSTSPLSSPQNLTDTIASIEHALYTHGLSKTLLRYREKWLANGKERDWKAFAAKLPVLWPSGQIPSVPPVDSRPGANVAVKLAMIDCLKGGGMTMFSPLHGEGSWTRDDEKVWGVAEVENSEDDDDDDESSENDEGEDETDDEDVNVGADEKDEGETGVVLAEIGRETDDEALYRCCSAAVAQEEMIIDPVVAWLEQISPTFAPPTTPMSTPKVETGLAEWEEKYLQDRGKEGDDACPFCCMRSGKLTAEVCNTTIRRKRAGSLTMQQELGKHFLSHSTESPAKRERTLTFQHGFTGRLSGDWKSNFDRNPGIEPSLKYQRNRIHRRASAQTRALVEDDQEPYMSSPRVQTVTQGPANHPEAAAKPRKRSFVNDNGLVFLSKYNPKLTKRRKIATPYTRVVLLPAPR